MKQPQTLKQAIETKKQNEPVKREPSEKENFENLARRVFSVPQKSKKRN